MPWTSPTMAERKGVSCRLIPSWPARSLSPPNPGGPHQVLEGAPPELSTGGRVRVGPVAVGKGRLGSGHDDTRLVAGALGWEVDPVAVEASLPLTLDVWSPALW